MINYWNLLIEEAWFGLNHQKKKQETETQTETETETSFPEVNYTLLETICFPPTTPKQEKNPRFCFLLIWDCHLRDAERRQKKKQKKKKEERVKHIYKFVNLGPFLTVIVPIPLLLGRLSYVQGKEWDWDNGALALMLSINPQPPKGTESGMGKFMYSIPSP